MVQSMTDTAERRSHWIPNAMYQWSGIIALVGTAVAFGSMQTEIRNGRDRDSDLAAQILSLQVGQANAASNLATKRDVETITARLDGLFQLILQDGKSKP